MQRALEEKEFKVVSSADGSFVMPEIPFSIMDKTDVLMSEGFSRFLIDLSRTKVSKGEFRQISSAYFKRITLPDVSRFNWKEGFYSQEKLDEYKAAAAAYAAGTFRPEMNRNGKGRKPFGKGKNIRNLLLPEIRPQNDLKTAG